MIKEIIKIDPTSDIPKYRQIEQSIIEGIADHQIKKNDQLPSINEICQTFSLSRDTVVKAYNALRERGAIDAAHGKGYYITGDALVVEKKVFILFNELNEYKETLHKSILQNLGEEVSVDTFFHNHNLELFEHLIQRAIGKYSHYVIMSTFNTNLKKVKDILTKIPSQKLFLIDRKIEGMEAGMIYQDFRQDTISGLHQVQKQLNSYKKIHVIYETDYTHPVDTLNGINDFCKSNNIEVTIGEIPNPLEPNIAYFTVKTDDLVKLVKTGNHQGYKPGTDYGILSYNEIALKEIIHKGITVISTDFEAMGAELAKQIKSGEQRIIHNKASLIKRGSL